MCSNVKITLIACLNDNGYVDYGDMIQNESEDNLAAMIISGLSDIQRLRLG